MAYVLEGVLVFNVTNLKKRLFEFHIRHDQANPMTALYYIYD